MSGPIDPISIRSNKYYLILVENNTKYLHIVCVKSKMIYTELENFLNLVKNKFSKSIKIFRSDRGGDIFKPQGPVALCRHDMRVNPADSR